MRHRLVGVAAALLAVSIWGGWLVFTRMTVTPGQLGAGDVSFTPMDIALMRNLAPGLILAPLWFSASLRESVAPRRAPIWTIVALNCWGAPFLALMGLGLARADAALGGALAPGLMPLLAAGLAFFFFGQKPGFFGRIGLPLVGLGALTTVLGRALEGGAAGDSLLGAPFIATASLCWAIYAVAFPRSNLTPLRATAIIGFWSTLVSLAAIGLGAESNLAEAPWTQIALAFLGHGIGAGLVSVAAFSLAISRLGTGPAAAFAALVPGLAATLGYLWLGDLLSVSDMIGLGLASAGVLIVNIGAARSPRRPAEAETRLAECR